MPSITRATVHTALSIAWTEHKKLWANCTDCALSDSRRKVVHYRGQLPCEILYIGEAPGDTEDALGTPMEGPTKGIVEDIHEGVIEAVMEHRMSTDVIDIPYAITNLVACRPPGNRDPHKEEIRACAPRLENQVLLAAGYLNRDKQAILPRKLMWAPKLKVIVLMGNIPTENFTMPRPAKLPHKPKIASTVHPAFIYRQQIDGLDSTVALNMRRAIRSITEAYLQR